jgi:hypothetical protein
VTYRLEFERRVKKVIVANAPQFDLRCHADHDLRECAFSTDVADGTVYSSMSSDSATMEATVRGRCGCGTNLNVTAEWPGYSLGQFFQAITDDAT